MGCQLHCRHSTGLRLQPGGERLEESVLGREGSGQPQEVSGEGLQLSEKTTTQG